MTNLRFGRPSRYFIAIGSIHRGFRNWLTQTYVGDDWKATQNLTLSVGLRWEPVTSPTEVNGLTQVPYDSDRNNFAPRFGLAYRLPRQWGVLRSSYGIHYGEIFTATYIQARLNPPQNVTVDVQAPDLADPLGGVDASDIDRNARSTPLCDRPRSDDSLHAQLQLFMGTGAGPRLEARIGLRRQPLAQVAGHVVPQPGAAGGRDAADDAGR